MQRREIFVNLGRVAEISIDGVHLRGGTVDLRRFSRRTGEILASELYGKRVEHGNRAGRRHRPFAAPARGLGGLGPGHRPRPDPGPRPAAQHTTIVPWDKHPELFKVSALAEQLGPVRGR